jgi:predicted amidophosphoribosyltransferase
VLRETVAALADLVLPSSCAGCGAQAEPAVCAACAAELFSARPHPTRPTPAPVGLPPCVALAAYDGVLRELLLAYKERGRHDATRALGALLAETVAAAVDRAVPAVLLIPVPATARAARLRYGDHMLRLARAAAGALRARGWPVAVAGALRAVPRPDSAGLDTAARVALAADTFRVRRQPAAAVRRAVGAGAVVVLVDDIVTTGATLGAAATRLGDIGIPVHLAAVLAATALRRTVVW